MSFFSLIRYIFFSIINLKLITLSIVLPLCCRKDEDSLSQWQCEFRGQIRALRQWLKSMEMRLPPLDPRVSWVYCLSVFCGLFTFHFFFVQSLSMSSQSHPKSTSVFFVFVFFLSVNFNYTFNITFFCNSWDKINSGDYKYFHQTKKTITNIITITIR